MGRAFRDGRHRRAGRGLVELIEGQGGTIRCNAEVEQILVERRRARPACGWPPARRSRPISSFRTPIRPGPIASCCRAGDAPALDRPQAGPVALLDGPVRLVFRHRPALRRRRAPHHPARAALSRAAAATSSSARCWPRISASICTGRRRPTRRSRRRAATRSTCCRRCRTCSADTDWRTAAEPYRKRIARAPVGDLLPDLIEHDRHLAHDDAARFPGPAECAARRRPSGWSRSCCKARGSARTTAARTSPASIWSAPARIRARACRACCRPPKFSTRWCRMPPCSFDLRKLPTIAACRDAICARVTKLSTRRRGCCRARCASRPSRSTRSAGCRDDVDRRQLGDGGGLAWLRERLALVYAGRPLAHARRSRVRPDRRALRHPSRFARGAARGFRLGRGRTAATRLSPSCAPTRPASPARSAP